MHTNRLICLAIAGCLLLTGCAQTQRVVDDPVILELTEPLAIDIESFSGDVIVVADPDATKTSVTVTRRGVHGIGRLEESEASLEEISYAVETVAGDLGPVLQIRTTTTHREPHNQRAHVHVRTPIVESVRIRTKRGDVHVEDNEGSIDIDVTRGNATVLTSHRIRHPVRINTRNGDVVYHVDGRSEGAYLCRTTGGGTVHHRVRLGDFRIRPGTDRHTLVATLNKGTNPVELVAEDGDVYVAVVERPTAISRVRYIP